MKKANKQLLKEFHNENIEFKKNIIDIIERIEGETYNIKVLNSLNDIKTQLDYLTANNILISFIIEGKN